MAQNDPFRYGHLLVALEHAAHAGVPFEAIWLEWARRAATCWVEADRDQAHAMFVAATDVWRAFFNIAAMHRPGCPDPGAEATGEPMALGSSGLPPLHGDTGGDA